MYYGTHYQSCLGRIFLACDEEHIIGLWLEGQKYLAQTMPAGIVTLEELSSHQAGGVLQRGVRWLDAYFAGERPDALAMPLALAGSGFRQCVWRLLTEIPYGKVTTYGALAREAARRMGKTSMSAQAVGQAVGHNPASIIVPCHRVVGADGGLTGYAGGVDKKAGLLHHEGVQLSGLDASVVMSAGVRFDW